MQLTEKIIQIKAGSDLADVAKRQREAFTEVGVPLPDGLPQGNFR